MVHDQIILAFLQKKLGLRVDAIGRSTVERAMDRRIRALGLAGREAYLECIAATPEELKELVEEVVIPETWFFRDGKPFEALVEHARGPWLMLHQGQTLRLLSVPCSTGEEPYSMAMALLRAGWPRDKFRITAIDISRRALARAIEGRYTENSFRGEVPGVRASCFTMEDGKYLPNPQVRENVRFQHGNLLDQPFMAGMGVFDIVFCRNVLIYLDETARGRAISILQEMVAEDGLLFTGHAEASLFFNTCFTPAPYHLAFAFRKKETVSCRSPGQAAPFSSPPAGVASPALPGTAQTLLQSARQAADRGALPEAMEFCQKHISQHGPSAGAFFLLGVIQDASGDQAGAFSSLRRAVYLDPDHGEALLLLSLLAEKMGEKNTAAAYRQRAERCAHDKETG